MLIDDLQADLKSAQLAKDTVKVETLRLLLSEGTYARISKGGDLTDADLVSLIQREVKKRKEATESFKAGNRPELALKEEKEAEVLMHYLPEQLSDEELSKIIEEVINETGAASVSEMGKVIGAVMPKVAGKADGGRVSALVKQKLVS
ncbi:hypothetical protein A3A14_04140 [Candidatus Daviesbacteria bacterium RIFCSPLOWO2_01_FULL_43_38]|uniref:GatB/YqeY domain-containing protein n=2 Tax=Candidatus Daviesiibacteriota TaxID=1752718 RepID=A0A0G1D1Q9_9BACT|nr:MAG: hypothetical protein UV33_C0017G0008 [Candidatus Daviesbacteria bacterium GW2011_GWA1_42_6]KKS70755.1 MAG: hypothetical protein UV41_C0014G0009 [Candidatus Daviesbacteria bacterium GW2011_GWA2_42_7]OGE20327.1 MAG: hypothetical protein A2874_04105 [Candidatus Daviesbacteria bacterium RIFCSPHIGHO2_01_FULL_43_17]OGE64046.1 MAG: hypothetical protein A3A14_04140 [Candidatus Daviesbacteria bacterium RIFCSPLOWO2_01_FULL_43_38]